MSDIPKSSLSKILEDLNPLRKTAKNPLRPRTSVPGGPTAADRARAAFKRHEQDVQRAQQMNADIRKRNRNY